MKKTIVSVFILSFLAYLLAPALLTIIEPRTVFAAEESPTATATQNTGTTNIDPGEDMDSDGPADLAHPAPYIGSLETLLFFMENESKLIISPEDMQKIRENKVDVRITDFLMKLIIPTDQGGYGFDHIKVKRIYRNYDTTGNGKYDRETLANNEEDNNTISTHHRGQAVDISEINNVPCKVHVSGGWLSKGSDTWIPPTAVKVAWQSKDGIANNPTPKGSNLASIAGSMISQSYLNMLNDSGELDSNVQWLKGIGLDDIAPYLAMSLITDQLDIKKITSDPLSDSMIRIIGTLAMKEYWPEIPGGLGIQNNDLELPVALALSRVEEGLDLSPGSLKSYGLNNILVDMGKRYLEETLSKPAGYADGNSLKAIADDPTNNAVINKWKQGDKSIGLDALDDINQKINEGNDKAYAMIGAQEFSRTFALNAQDKTNLEAVAKGEQPEDYFIRANPQMATNDKISDQDLDNLISPEKPKQQSAKDSLMEQGRNILSEAAVKNTATADIKFRDDAKKQLASLIKDPSKFKLGDVKELMAVPKISEYTGLDQNQIDRLIDSDKTNDGEILADALTKQLNKNLRSSDNTNIKGTDFSKNDIIKLISAVSLGYTLKNEGYMNLAGYQFDKVMKWDTGTGFDFFTGKISFGKSMEAFSTNQIGRIIGADVPNFSFSGDVWQNFGDAITANRLGMTAEELAKSPTAGALQLELGSDEFQRRYGFTLDGKTNEASLDYVPGSSRTQLMNADQNRSKWELEDARLNLPRGTTEKYLSGQIDTKAYSKAAGQGNLETITAEKIVEQFNLDDNYGIETEDMQKVIQFIKNPAEYSQDMWTIIGNLASAELAKQINLLPDTFKNLLTDDGIAKKINSLLDQGVQKLASAIGVNLGENFLDEMNTAYCQYQRDLPAGAPIPPTGCKKFDNSVQALEFLYTSITKFFDLGDGNEKNRYASFFTTIAQKAFDIPDKYSADINAFIRGDMKVAFSAFSYKYISKSINQYLPEGSRLTYEEYRKIFIVTDEEAATRAKANLDVKVDSLPDQGFPGDTGADFTTSGVESDFTSLEPTEQDIKEARKQLINEAKQNVTYKISDAYLRKVDSAIPVGFTRAMMKGTWKEKQTMLLTYAFNKMDEALILIIPGWQEGMTKAIYDMTPEQRTAAIAQYGVTYAIKQANLKLGPFQVEDLVNVFDYIKASDGERTSMITDTDGKYSGTWHAFDQFLRDKLNIQDLPSGITRSILLSYQNKWSLKSEIKNSDGTVRVQSLESMGKEYLISKIAAWADQALGMPAGSMYKIYQAATAYAKADAIYKAAKAANAAAKTADSANKLNTAKAGANSAKIALVLMVIDIALTMCDACQKFFGDIDKALNLPPGATQQLIMGAAAMLLGLGPAGLIAAGVYIVLSWLGAFGGEISYLCQLPPKDSFSVGAYDNNYDQLIYKWADGKGDNYVVPTPVEIKTTCQKQVGPTGTPQQLTDCQRNIINQYMGDMNDQDLWMAWARYNTGLLLKSSLDYGLASSITSKPRQIMTYRQANVEFFGPDSGASFGSGYEANNPFIGIGYTQKSSKTTDWVHVSFGGPLQ